MGKKVFGASQIMSRFRAGYRRGRFIDQPASAELSQGQTVSRRRENRLCARAELLLLPGSLRRLSHRGVSGGSGLFQVQLFLLYHRLSHFAGSPAGALYLRFSVPFGWFQELLHKIPTKKFSTKKLKPLRYLKYAVLLVMVFLLPAFLVNDVAWETRSSANTSAPKACWRGPSRCPLPIPASGRRWASCLHGNSASCCR